MPYLASMHAGGSCRLSPSFGVFDPRKSPKGSVSDPRKHSTAVPQHVRHLNMCSVDLSCQVHTTSLVATCRKPTPAVQEAALLTDCKSAPVRQPHG